MKLTDTAIRKTMPADTDLKLRESWRLPPLRQMEPLRPIPFWV